MWDQSLKLLILSNRLEDVYVGGLIDTINIMSSIVKFDELAPVYYDHGVGTWKEHLNKYGWTTVKIDGWNDNYVDIFHKSLDKVHFWEGISSAGLIDGGMGQTELQWRIRELCLKYFIELYECEDGDLLCSFDGGCFMKPTNITKFKDWLHTDFPVVCYPQLVNEKYNVQGLVNFIQCGPKDGGLVLMDSRNIFMDHVNKYPEYKNGGDIDKKVESSVV